MRCSLVLASCGTCRRVIGWRLTSASLHGSSGRAREIGDGDSNRMSPRPFISHVNRSLANVYSISWQALGVLLSCGQLGSSLVNSPNSALFTLVNTTLLPRNSCKSTQDGIRRDLVAIQMHAIRHDNVAHQLTPYSNIPLCAVTNRITYCLSFGRPSADTMYNDPRHSTQHTDTEQP